MADDVDQQIDQAGTKALFRAKDIGGKKHPFAVLTDPSDGAAIKPASQADVEGVRDRLPAGGAASDAGLAAIAAIVAMAATEATLSALLTRTPVAPATEAKQDTGNTSLGSIVTALAALIKVGVRRDTDTTPLADGEAGALFTDELGRLKTSSYPASQAQASGAITASGQQVALDVSRTSNVTFGLTGTSLSGHNATFEASLDSTNGTDGTWYAVQAVRSNANTIELTTGVLAATPVYMWEASVNGYKWFRVRATAHTGGTATYVIRPAPFATEPIPAAQTSGTQPVSGTVTANIGTGSLAAGANAIGDVGTQYRANATGAASGHHVVSLGTSGDAVNVKNAAGRVVGWMLANTTATWRYVKLHNTNGTPTAGTGVVRTIAIPPNGVAALHIDGGIGFATGIARTVVTGAADADATLAAANDVVGDIFFA